MGSKVLELSKAIADMELYAQFLGASRAITAERFHQPIRLEITAPMCLARTFLLKDRKNLILDSQYNRSEKASLRFLRHWLYQA